ncbi:MAG: caspase family protein [Burkholderiales bacterium]
MIGNDNYTSVSKLLNARADATALGKVLVELGYKVTVRQDLTEKEMKSALRQFRNEVEGGDEVLFFYAGHGVQLGSANYLLPIDIKGDSEEQVKDEAIELQRVLDSFNEKRVKLALAVIDACRDNPFPKSGRAIGGRGLAPTTAATGQMVVFSAGSGQQALDKLGPGDKDPNGLFTRVFLNEIRTPGVRVDNVIREVRKKVVDAAKSIGHEQVPAIYDQVVGDFYFKR